MTLFIYVLHHHMTNLIFVATLFCVIDKNKPLVEKNKEMKCVIEGISHLIEKNKSSYWTGHCQISLYEGNDNNVMQWLQSKPLLSIFYLCMLDNKINSITFQETSISFNAKKHPLYSMLKRSRPFHAIKHPLLYCMISMIIYATSDM